MWLIYLGFVLLGISIPLIIDELTPDRYTIEYEKSITFRTIQDMLQERNKVLKEHYNIYEDDYSKGAIAENKRLLYMMNNEIKSDEELKKETEKELEEFIYAKYR